MKRILPLLLAGLLLAVTAQAKVADNQDYIDRPKSENWFVYLDFNLRVFEDMNLASFDVDHSTFAPDPEAPFDVDEDNDLFSRTNCFTIGISQIFKDKGDYGRMRWYAGAGSASSNLELFQSGSIGVKGWNVEAGIQGDIMKFGTLLDKGLEIDCSFKGIMATGTGKPDQDYEFDSMALNAALYYKFKTDLIDTTEAYVYLGGQLSFVSDSLVLDMKTLTGSGTGTYDLTNQGMDLFMFVAGTRMYWESNRTTMDIGLCGSIDGGYSVMLKLLQTF